MNITFTVPAIPIAQPRQRHRIVTGESGSFVSNYTPAKAPVNDFKATVRMAAREAYFGPLFTGPLRCDACCVFPRTKGQLWKRRPMPRIRHAKKPDMENVYKAILDCLTGLWWVDDSQVCEGMLEKWIASGDEQPHVVITVSTLEP